MESGERSSSSSVTVADPSRAASDAPKPDTESAKLHAAASASSNDLRHLPHRPVTHGSAAQDVEQAAGDLAPVEPEPEQPDPNLITWAGPDDPENPQNWNFWTKVGISLIWVFANLVTCVASSIYSSGVGQLQEEFGMSLPVATLGISLFLVGYAIGPPIYGPMSEKFGRKWPAFVGVFGFSLFCLPVALGQNIQTILLGRFFEGCFGVAPLAIVSSVFTFVPCWSFLELKNWSPIGEDYANFCL